MSPIRVRAAVRRGRRRLALVTVVLALAAVVVAHHADPMDMHGMAAAAACLAVVGTGAALVAVAVRLGTSVRSRELGWPITVSRVPFPRTVPARAGPLHLRLAVLRR